MVGILAAVDEIIREGHLDFQIVGHPLPIQGKKSKKRGVLKQFLS